MATKAQQYAKLLGLKHNEPYPCLLEVKDGRVVATKRKYGTFKIPNAILVGYDDGNNCDEEGCLFSKEITVKIPFSEISKSLLFGNLNNPREPLYDKKREDINITYFEKYYMSCDTNKGSLISVKNCAFSPYNSEDEGHFNAKGDITFNIPENDKRYGLYDGQNLWMYAINMMEVYKNNKSILKFNPEKTYIRVTFRIYPESVSAEDIAFICKANNTMISQSELSLLTYQGKFDRFFENYPDNIKSAFEFKANAGATAFISGEVKNLDMGNDEDYSDSVNEVLEDLIPIDSFFRAIAMADWGVTMGYTRNQTKIAREAMKVGKSKSNAIKAAINAIKKADEGTPSVFSYQHMLDAGESFWRGIDYILSYDYSTVSETYLKTLGIKPCKKMKVTSISKTPMLYDIPILVLNEIYFAVGGLYNKKNKDDGDFEYTLDVDIPKFWDKNCEKIFKILSKNRNEMKEVGIDSYGYYRNIPEIEEMWIALYELAEGYKNTKKNQISNTTKKYKAAPKTVKAKSKVSKAKKNVVIA